MQLTDTHCHIHEAGRPELGSEETRRRWQKAPDPDPDHMIARASEVGVTRLLCVGTTVADSVEAVNFAQGHENIWATIGIHPHEAERTMNDQVALDQFRSLADKPKVVAVGECGLDYFYTHSSKEAQIRCLHFQLELAQKYHLSLVFHVREAFADFWPIFDAYPTVKGVIHSFTATQAELEQCLQRGLYIGLNGIMTFTQHTSQLDAARAIPLDKLLLETDAPYLTPKPFRGSINEPKYVRIIAEFLANLRGETLDALAAATTQNARLLFGI